MARHDTPINISDLHGLNITLPIGQIDGGNIYRTTYQGPYGHQYAQALSVILNVNFYTDGTGAIALGSYYPTEELDDSTCIADISILPITDELVYSSDLEANLTIPSTNILGYVPDENPDNYVAVDGIPIGYTTPLPFAGQTAGSISLSQSTVFDFFPATPAQPTLCDEPGGMGNCFDVILDDGQTIDGGNLLPGFAGGYAMKGNLKSIAPTENSCADLYIEWHAIDGPISGNGLGDIIGHDEDGDGTDFDRIWSIESLLATYLDPGCGYNYPVFGDITAQLESWGLDGCFDRLDIATSGYVMDETLSDWSNFLTYNALNGVEGDDGAHDYNGTDGRLVMHFDPMCIQDIMVRHVMLEFVNTGGNGSCPAELGDINGDGGWNVLDVVTLANCVLSDNCGDLNIGCAGDLNGDGGWNVLDVVTLANCVLADNCLCVG